MSTWSQTPPTEEGKYLFMGVCHAHDALEYFKGRTHVEIIKIVRLGNGDKMMVGEDVYRTPPAGLWMDLRYEISDNAILLDFIVIEQLARRVVPECFRYRESIYALKTTLVDAHIPEGRVEEVIRKAVELGIIAANNGLYTLVKKEGG